MFHIRLKKVIIIFLLGNFFFFLGCRTGTLKKSDFVILFSNDVLGELENCGCDDAQLGGLPRKAKVISITKKEDREYLSLDAGNLFFRKPPLNEIERKEFLLKSEYILRAYNQMGCDGLNIGEADFILGLDALIDLRKKANFPFISSNILDKNTGAPVFQPVVFREISGLRVGILGLCPGSEKVDHSVLVDDPVAAVKKMVEKIRNQCDFIIVLSSLGLELDKVLAKQAPRINLIISGKADRLLTEAVIEGNTMIVQAYRRGQYLGRLDIKTDCSDKQPCFKIGSLIIPLKEEIGCDKGIVSIVKKYKTKLVAMNKQEFFKERLRTLNDEVKGSLLYKGMEQCKECHLLQYENWQNTFHAEAYETLVKDSSNYDVECLPCHTTGYSEPGGYSIAQAEESHLLNVQCESCHGPGSNHSEKSGILRDGGEKVCLGCHDEKNSPNFDYEQYLPLVKCPVN